MIQLLNNKNKEIAKEIQSLFYASYAIEAQILGAADFPPLKRKLEDYIYTDTVFYGLFDNNDMAAIVEVKTEENNTNIQSLVVHPNYFRQGYGKQLMNFVLNAFNSETFTVETGLENEPASKLYLQLGFKEVEQWDTLFGIRKIKFKKEKRT